MEQDNQSDIKTLLPAVGVSIFLVLVIGFAVAHAKTQSGTVVLPGGVTYLGPTPTPTPTIGEKFSNVMGGQIPIPDNAEWIEYKGKILPYRFNYPNTISLGVFPNDPYDSVTVFYNGTDAQGNLFFRVEDLRQLQKESFITKPKLEYVNQWWKDYSWTGVSKVTPFTNGKGLVGYRAKYTDSKGQTPYEHIFFEVPGNKNLIIWISGKLFSQTVFDKLVDSVSWTK